MFGSTFELWPSFTHGPFKLEHLFSVAVFTAVTHAVLLYRLHITCIALAILSPLTSKASKGNAAGSSEFKYDAGILQNIKISFHLICAVTTFLPNV